jgi:hypothetical protein
LVSSYASIEDRRERILKGLHGLHHYAHAFWIEHFLKYAHLLGSLDSAEAAEVIKQVRRLLNFKKEDWVAKVGRNSIKIEPHQQDCERLAVLSTISDVADFVPEVLAFQQVLVQEDNRRSQKGILNASNPPNPLLTAVQIFENINWSMIRRISPRSSISTKRPLSFSCNPWTPIN